MGDRTYEQGLEIPVSVPPKRVVSLVPSMTESLFELNLGGRVVGITDYCVHPADQLGGLPRIGGTKNPDIAQIIALKPDLVIANQEENRKEDVEALQAAGIPVWVTFPKTVADVFNILWNTMYVFDETSMVPRVRLIEYTADWLGSMAQQREDRGEVVPKVFVPIWRDPYMTFNQDTYAHHLLMLCGAQNVFADRLRDFPLKADLGQGEPLAEDDPRRVGRDTRYPRITVDEIVAAQPDIVLLPSEPFVFGAEDAAFFASLDIPAAKNRQIHLVDGSLLLWHGTRIARALDTLPALFVPSDRA